ncbi:MAG: sigma-70 family RNA polymerase sigma factor [Hormoscilla sp. GUM202]|nr:sigma-70 family RNA polymerase sigma factor [Hormoscilla sp. GUM202]
MMMATASARGKDFRDGAAWTETGPSEIVSRFWQVWLEEEDKLYHRCLRLMNFNPTEAEDALGQARIKAWEKVQELGSDIRNLTAWLMQLTSNLCKDLLKKDSRGPVAVENIELVGETGVLCTVSSQASPQMVLESEERDVAIGQAVASLSPGMRDTFALHYYEELEYTEIAE